MRLRVQDPLQKATRMPSTSRRVVLTVDGEDGLVKDPNGETVERDAECGEWHGLVW
jgi:hypothetical protein